MKQAIKAATKLDRFLQRQSRRLKLPCDVDLKIRGYEEAHSQKEDDGKLYVYPETLEIKIENRNNYFYSIRTFDGRWIAEGTELNGPGKTMFQVARRMVREMKAWAKTAA